MFDDCLEFGDLIRLRAFRDDDVTFQLPFQKEKFYLGSNEFGFSGNASPIEIPFDEGSGRIRVSDKTLQGHRVKTVEISWDSSKKNEREVLDILKVLEDGWFHLEATYFSSVVFWVRATCDSYHFSFTEDGKVYSCRLVIQNTCGAQRVFDESL